MADDPAKPADDGKPNEPDPGILANSPQPQPDPQPAPELVTVKVGDQEVKVDKATADVIAAQNERVAAEMDQLRRRPAPEPKPAPEPGKPEETDWEDLMLNNPAAFAQKIREDVTQDLTNRYNAQTTMDTFWSDFYDANDDLKPHKGIVNAVMNQNMGILGDMPATEASTKLAELTRGEIVNLVKKFGSKEPQPGSQQQRTAVETGEGPSPSEEPAPTAGDAKITSMTDALKERRKSRRKAAQGGTAA